MHLAKVTAVSCHAQSRRALPSCLGCCCALKKLSLSQFCSQERPYGWIPPAARLSPSLLSSHCFPPPFLTVAPSLSLFLSFSFSLALLSPTLLLSFSSHPRPLPLLPAGLAMQIVLAGQPCIEWARCSDMKRSKLEHGDAGDLSHAPDKLSFPPRRRSPEGSRPC